jgi:hypothetical protein
MLDGPLTRACCALYATRHLGCGPVAHGDHAAEQAIAARTAADRSGRLPSRLNRFGRHSRPTMLEPRAQQVDAVGVSQAE